MALSVGYDENRGNKPCEREAGHGRVDALLAGRLALGGLALHRAVGLGPAVRLGAGARGRMATVQVRQVRQLAGCARGFVEDTHVGWGRVEVHAAARRGGGHGRLAVKLHGVGA